MSTPHEPDIFKIPFPPDFADEDFTSIQARASAFCGAAEAIYAAAQGSGQEVIVPEEDAQKARDVFAGTKPISTQPTTAEMIHLTALLQAYDMTVVQSAQQLRNFCTNLLIDKAATAKTDQAQLRAVEMLGKIKDVALFEERSTILVEHMTTEQIQAALREKINRMRGVVTATDVTFKESR